MMLHAYRCHQDILSHLCGQSVHREHSMAVPSHCTVQSMPGHADITHMLQVQRHRVTLHIDKHADEDSPKQLLHRRRFAHRSAATILEPKLLTQHDQEDNDAQTST